MSDSRYNNQSPTIASLNTKLYQLIATMPKARTELVDFFFKHAVDDYVSAIRTTPGRKALALSREARNIDSVIRRAMIAADTVGTSENSRLTRLIG
ncbi:MAG: hypothetical protein ABR964_09685 [Tepidisphaeraceae bacterium]|jgi:hypothetical protein